MNNSALQRLAYKAGANRVNSSVYDRARVLGEHYLKVVIKYAIIYCEHENKKTVNDEHVLHAIEHVGFTDMYPAYGDVKKCKKSVKKKLISRIKEYQNQSECVTFSKAPIEGLIKTLGYGFRWTKDATLNMQFALEYMLHQLFSSALKITINAKRITMLESDLNLALDIITTNCKNIRLS